MHNEQSIKALLDASDAAVMRAVHAIQARQTADEQAGHLTKHTNGVGWSKFDAAWMADMIIKARRYGGLTPKQMAVTRNKVKRYHRQLVEIANENLARKSAMTAPGVGVATMSSVSPDGVSSAEQGEYQRLKPQCECENYDGERLCPWCERIADKAAIQKWEAEQEARAGYGEF